MRSILPEERVAWKPFGNESSADKNEAHVFRIKSACTITNPILTKEEIERASRFLHQSDKERYIAGRHSLRSILANFLSLAPEEIQFFLYGNKKPGVEGIEFNVSHSGDYILVAVSPCHIGVDIEHINRGIDAETVLTSSFTKKEIEYIKEGNDACLHFYTLWTRKEALLKASGEGLIDELDQLSCLEEHVTHNQQQYTLSSFRPADEYVACIAIANSEKGKINYWDY